MEKMVFFSNGLMKSPETPNVNERHACVRRKTTEPGWQCGPHGAYVAAQKIPCGRAFSLVNMGPARVGKQVFRCIQGANKKYIFYTCVYFLWNTYIQIVQKCCRTRFRAKEMPVGKGERAGKAGAQPGDGALPRMVRRAVVLHGALLLRAEVAAWQDGAHAATDAAALAMAGQLNLVEDAA